MITIEQYLEYIQEQRGPRGKPSPSFAYELVHGKPAPSGRTGRCPSPTKQKRWNGMYVDANLKNEWLRDLNKIKNVEIRGVCEGHNEDWPAYVSFRISPEMEKNKPFLDKIAKTLSSYKYTVCGWDQGALGRPRFVCATPLYYGHPDKRAWIEWWSKLSDRIAKVVNT